MSYFSHFELFVQDELLPFFRAIYSVVCDIFCIVLEFSSPEKWETGLISRVQSATGGERL